MLSRVQSPQEGDDPRSRAVVVGAEEVPADAIGDPVVRGPLDGFGVISSGFYIAERAGLDFRGKDCPDLDLAGGHDKGVLAVALVGELQRVAVLVGVGEIIQPEAIFGPDRDGHGAALGNAFHTAGDAALLRLAGKIHGAGDRPDAGGGTVGDGQRAVDEGRGVIDAARAGRL